MTLSVVVGSSGSGKTTLLEDVQKLNNAVYIRQYHTLRPYIQVSKIPNFDPTRLPYWSLYTSKDNESYNPKIKIGGTMAGEFTAGLSGGQRKMMLFELVCQRTQAQSDLLICLDEPFAGVTDDFVPWIIERLNELRKKHNVLLVTNDHVAALTGMADNTITVSAINRSTVSVNGCKHDREVLLHAVSSGKKYQHAIGNQDLWFFWSTEGITNPQVLGVLGFTTFSMILFLLTFWDSQPGSEALVMVAIQIVAFFSINPYLVALTDWRNAIREEAEALMHSSTQTNLNLKSCVALLLITVICLASFGILNLCIDTLRSFEYWVFMLFDSASLTLTFICLGLYSRLPFQTVQILAGMPFLLMIFFSTTFSPGAGVAGVNALRYLFTRFYFWCRVPGVKVTMEGCPSDAASLGYAILTGFLGLIIFLTYQFFKHQVGGRRKEASQGKKRAQVTSTREFELVKQALYKNRTDEEGGGSAAADVPAAAADHEAVSVTIKTGK
jgi:ABC-type lipoprotein export system ATPase subunit